MASHAKSPRKHHRIETTRKSVTFDGLRDLSPLNKNVGSTEAIIGAALALALGAGVKYGLNRLNVNTKREDGSGGIPDLVMKYAGPLSTFLGGALLYLGRRKSNRPQAESFLVGGTIAAVAPVAWSLLGQYGPKLPDGTPFFSDYVMSPYGALTSDAQPALAGHTLDEAPYFNGYAGDPFVEQAVDGGFLAP